MISGSADLEGLFNRLADGIASEADEQPLGELLRASPQARRAYREFMALHSALYWDYVATVSPEPPPQSAPPISGRDSRLGWRVSFVAGTVVATVVVLAVLQWFTLTTADKPAASVVEEKRDDIRGNESAVDRVWASEDAIAALMVDEVGAKFAEGRAPDGVQFRPGVYELLDGVMHLRFAQGADVVLGSPARLEVKDAQHIRLAYGKIRVTAPPTAKGFTIATRDADYIDLGTEFGLRVDPQSGASDLYVFDGQVNVAHAQTGKVLSEVVEGQSSRAVDGAIVAAPELQGEDFPTPGGIGLDRWQQHEHALRHDRGLLALFPFHRTSDDSVLVNSLRESKVAPGRIKGARWVSGRWPGKDALLFDRDNDFVQIDLPGEYQELTVTAWLKIERLDCELNAIFNSDGYDLGKVHFQLTRQGLPRGGVVVAGQFHEQVIGNAVPVGSWAHVASVMSVPTRSQRTYVNGVLSRQRDLQGSEVIRPGSCRLGNWLPVTHDAFANRALRGRVDELAIWSRALSESEVQELVAAGRPGMLWSEE